jgi:Ca2+-binding EF-hand superfamily protein
MDARDLPKALRAIGALVNDIEIKHLLDIYDPSKSGFISFADF